MANDVVARPRTAGDILGKSASRTVAHEIFIELHPGLANEEQELISIFTPQKASQFLEQLTDLQALLSTSDSYDQLIAKLDAQIAKAESVRDELLGQLFEQIRPLERSYRQVALFFENTKAADGIAHKPAELHIFNAEPRSSRDIRSNTILAFEEFAKRRNGSFNFRETVCNIVVPGFLSQMVREKYEEIAFERGMLMVTDTDDERTYKALDKQFNAGGKYEFLKRAEDQAAADVATVGYLNLRPSHWFEKKESRVDKGDDLYAPPSMALAGAMVRSDDTAGLGQGPIGFRFGRIKGVDGCRLELLVEETERISMGHQLVPVVRDDSNHLCFYGCRTLADDPYGPYKFFTSYRILRHIERMCRHYLLGVAGEALTRDAVDARIQAPLDKMLKAAEEEGLITSYSLTIDRSSSKLENGIVDISLEVAPTGPAETFVLKIEPPKRSEAKQSGRS